MNYIEQLSSNLKEITFSLGDKKYIAFTIYENIGLHKDFDEKLVEEAFSEQHALIARIRTKDSYRNGLEGKYLGKWQNNCRCSILSGRYHISARIEAADEILMTLNDIAAYKFGEPVNNFEGEVNIVRRLLMEGKAEYLNERILYGINMAKTKMHLNYHFAKSFNITEEYTEMEILKNEIQFVMKYYYKNRKRYMEGET